MEGRFKYKLVETKKNVKTFEVSVEKSLEQEYYEKQFQRHASNVKISGFRPGKAPRNVVEPKVAMDALNDTINALLPDVTVQVIVKEDITPLGRIKYDIEEVQKDGELKYKFTVHTYPEIDVAKVKKIKVEVKLAETKDSEADDVIRNIIRGTLPEEKWGNKSEKSTEEKSDDSKDKKDVVVEVNNSFEITDELVKALNYDDAPDVATLRKQVLETLEKNKQNQYETELLEKAMEKVAEIVDMEVPHELVHQEADHRQADFESRLKQLNLNLDDYLKTQGKTLEDLHSDWEKDIEKMIFRDVFAVQLANVENLIPSEDELDVEIDKIEDELTRVRYKGNKEYRDQFRTMVSVNKGLERFISWLK